MSGKSEYICKLCKQVNKVGFLGGGKRYKCPTHGVICENCVKTGLIRSSKCIECESKVITYSWDKKKSKWVNA